MIPPYRDTRTSEEQQSGTGSLNGIGPLNTYESLIPARFDTQSPEILEIGTCSLTGIGTLNTCERR
jgi:hypothetical protein